jgi:hypothetical protein
MLNRLGIMLFASQKKRLFVTEEPFCKIVTETRGFARDFRILGAYQVRFL